jgi:hypothetical protein
MDSNSKEMDTSGHQMNEPPNDAVISMKFTYLSIWDVVTIIASCVSAIIAGGLNPLLTVRLMFP